jgi:glycine/D-amino acid oxidase-like deaminating enzyme
MPQDLLFHLNADNLLCISRLQDDQDKVLGVHIKNRNCVIEADKVVICMGPWSSVFIEDIFGVDSLALHSFSVE